MQPNEIQIRNKFLVEVLSENGDVIAKAVRAGTESSWQIGKLIDGKMINYAEIFPWIPENVGRHMVFACLGAII